MFAEIGDRHEPYAATTGAADVDCVEPAMTVTKTTLAEVKLCFIGACQETRILRWRVLPQAMHRWRASIDENVVFRLARILTSGHGHRFAVCVLSEYNHEPQASNSSRYPHHCRR
jgi:hypothetical protein